MAHRHIRLMDNLPMPEWQRLRRLELSGATPVQGTTRLVPRLADGLSGEEWQRVRNLALQGEAELRGGGSDEELLGGAGGDDLSDSARGGIPSSAWGGSPARREAQDALQATPMNPEALRYLPVTGSVIDSYEAARRGEVLPALGHAALALGDVGMLATGVGVVGAIGRRTAWNTGKMTGNAVRQQMKRRGVTPDGYDLHHSVELNGIPRNVPNWRNHPAFMKPLPRSDHKRMRGRDLKLNLPEFNGFQKFVVGTPTWMKTVPSGVGVHAVEGAIRAFEGPNNEHPARPRPPAPYGERPLR